MFVALAVLFILPQHQSTQRIHIRSVVTTRPQSIMRKEVGSMALDELMHNRASLNSAICMGMAGLEESWGIKVTRYEVETFSEKRFKMHECHASQGSKH